jgi:hypothetical protein
MKSKMLGDSLDLYKRWFLKELLDMENVPTVLMRTGDWSEPDTRAYEALLPLKIVQADLVPNDSPTSQNRKEYFERVKRTVDRGRDLFVDPNTGFRTESNLPEGRQYQEYFFLSELEFLLTDESSGRMVVFYDHSLSKSTPIEAAVNKLRSLPEKQIHWFAYCGQAAMIVASRQKRRVVQVADQAKKLPYLPSIRIKTGFYD